MKLVFASGNKNKLQEIQAALPVGIEVVSMRDVGVNEEIPETQSKKHDSYLKKRGCLVFQTIPDWKSRS